jgi:hypothetical protein
MKPSLYILAAFLALELPAPALQDDDSKFMMAVLRRDGGVIPFAAFDDGRWRARWPAGIQNVELPISLDRVDEDWWGIEPAPRTMTIWRDGARAGTVNLTGLSVTRPMCEPRITLRSDYKSGTPPPPALEMPYPKDGLLTSGSVTVEAIQSVEKGSADWNRVANSIKKEFDQQETRASRVFRSWVHPVKEEQRKLVPISVEALYRAPTADPKWTAYYVEAVRQYPPGPQDRDGCGLLTFGHGWVLVSEQENEVKVRLAANVTYCDRKGVAYMLPLGLIRADEKVYWIFQFSGFEEEWYEVAEPMPGRVQSHIVYPVGVCPM